MPSNVITVSWFKLASIIPPINCKMDHHITGNQTPSIASFNKYLQLEACTQNL